MTRAFLHDSVRGLFGIRAAVADRRNLLAVALLCLSFLCIALGTLDGPALYGADLSAALWLLCLAAGALALVFAAPDMFVYTPLVAAQYALVFFGILFATGYDGLLYKGAGAAMIAVSVFLALFLMARVKDARDVLAGSPQSDDGGVALGFWFLANVAFFAASAASVYSWVLWAKHTSPLSYYAFFSAFAAASFVFVMIYPQMSFDWRTLEKEGASWRFPFAFGFGRARMGAWQLEIGGTGKGALGVCKECGAALAGARKTCPSCGQEDVFYWCPSSEEFVVKCGICGADLYSHADFCAKCGSAVTGGVMCKHCKRESALSEWVGVQAA